MEERADPFERFDPVFERPATFPLVADRFMLLLTPGLALFEPGFMFPPDRVAFVVGRL